MYKVELSEYRKCLSQIVQSDWLLRGPLFHLETSAEVFYGVFLCSVVQLCSFVLLLQLPIASALD